MSSYGMRMWQRHAAWRRVARARVAPQRGKSSHALTTTTTTTTGVCDALDTTIGLGADTLARSLEQRHMVQRLLRRLPVGTSSTLLYLNELPSMLKTGLVRLALTTRREQQQQQQQQQQGVTASAADTRTLLRLRAPHASVSDAALTSMAAAYRVRPRTTTPASWQQQQRTVQALPSSCARDVDDGVANGDDVCDVQAPVLLVPQTQQRHECTLGVCVSASPLMSSSPSSSLCVTSASSALRVDYRHTPQLYILGLPAALVRDAVREHDDDDDNSSSDSSSDVACRDEVVAQLLRRWLVYDEDTQQLMLLLPRRRRHGRHWHRCAPHAFLAQTYTFSPHDAFAAAVAAAAVERSDDNNNDHDAVASCDYRLFFLVAATDDVGVAATTTTAATTTAGAAVASSSSSAAAGVALRDVGALYPSSFTTVAVDVPVTSLSSSSLSSSSPSLSRRAGVAWTPLSMKRLRYRGGGVDDGSDSSGHAPTAHLWGGQLVDLGVAHTSTVAAAMPTLRPHTRSGIAGRPGSSNATATATTSMVLQEREWLQLAERSFAASRAALLQRSAQRTLQHDDDDDKDKCSRTETNAHGRRSDAAAAAVVDDGHDVVHAMTTPYDTHTHTSADAATMTTLSAARVRHVRFTAAVAMPVAPAPLRADAASPLAAALHRALYRYKHELYTRLQQLATRTATATTATEGPQQQHSAANVSPPPSSLLTTALDDAMVARERVLLPFLRQPRQLPLSFVDDTHHCRAQEMHNNDNDDSENSNSNSSNDETSRTRTRRGGAVAAADFVPVLWQMRELEAVTGWRRYGAWFAQRYGALRDVVSADMLVTLGDGAHNAYARRHDDDADERRAGVCATATTATMTTCIERAYYPAQPFVLLHDDVYVQRVLLPALRRYAHALHTHTSKTRVRHDNNNNNNNSDDDDEGVQARVPLSVRKACRRHGMCLQTWLQSLRALDAHARTNALRLRGHIDARDTTVTRTAAHVPAALRALLAAALQQQQEQQQQQQQQSSTASSPTVRFVAVPIAPFLEWATLPPCCRHRRRRGGGRVPVFSHADVVRFVQYALCYAAHMDVTAGDGTTVAFVVASADDRGATRS